MSAKSFSIGRGTDGFKISDFTVGTLAPNANDVELRFNLTDTNGKTLTKLDVVKAMDAFYRAIEFGRTCHHVARHLIAQERQMFASSFAPPPAPQDFKVIFDLLAAISDPKAAKQRLEQLKAAADEARTLIENAQNAPAEIGMRLKEYEAIRGKAEQDHGRKLARMTADFDERCAALLREATAKQSNAAELEAKAKSDADAAALLRADFQNRLNKIRAAVE